MKLTTAQAQTLAFLKGESANRPSSFINSRNALVKKGLVKEIVTGSGMDMKWSYEVK